MDFASREEKLSLLLWLGSELWVCFQVRGDTLGEKGGFYDFFSLRRNSFFRMHLRSFSFQALGQL